MTGTPNIPPRNPGNSSWRTRSTATEKPPRSTANASNPCAGPFGRVYDFYIERPWLSTLVGRVVWGVDVDLLYRNLAAVTDVPAGGTICDVGCGGGLALRALRVHQRVDYLAVDLDPDMLERTARRAESLGLHQVKTVCADAAALPIPTDSVDLALCHGALHCFALPGAALLEIARVLRPGGRLIGTTFVAPGTRRQRVVLEAERLRSGLPALWSAERLHEAFRAAGLTVVELTASNGLVAFEASASPVGSALDAGFPSAFPGASAPNTNANKNTNGNVNGKRPA